MEKTKMQKRLLPIGMLCLSAGLILKFVVELRGNKLDFFIGLLIGLGITLLVCGFIKGKLQSQA